MVNLYLPIKEFVGRIFENFVNSSSFANVFGEIVTKEQKLVSTTDLSNYSYIEIVVNDAVNSWVMWS